MQIHLPNEWTPRSWQLPLWEALAAGKKRACAVWHRRAGKDLTVLNYIAWASQRRVGTYWHVAPTYTQGRKIIWDGIRSDGRRYLDAFPGWRSPSPTGFVTRVRDDEMRLWLANGSIFQIIGSEEVDRLVGPNPVGIAMTEYSLQDPTFWEYMRPILMENGGWAVFIYTPRGKNHGHRLYQMAKENPEWYCELLTCRDTEKMARENGEEIPITEQAIEDARREGMDEALIAQEFECGFDAPLEGAYYGDIMTRIRQLGQLGRVPHEPTKPVVTAWDIGIGDATAIVFAQPVGHEVRIVDFYQSHSQGLDHYVKVVKEKPYVYKEHLAPHDIKVREYGSGGRSRIEMARDLGLHFHIVRKLSIEDGIQATRSLLPRCWFNDATTGKLIEALSEYTKAKDHSGEFMSHPKKDWTNHPCDAFRMLAVGLREERQRVDRVLAPKLAIV